MTKSPEAFRTIREVAEWLDTPAHVLRFWESRFSQIKPVKRAGGRRYYRPSDMELLGGIKQLLHNDGLTIKGVQKILRDEGVKHVMSLSTSPGDLQPSPETSAPKVTVKVVSKDEIATMPQTVSQDDTTTPSEPAAQSEPIAQKAETTNQDTPAPIAPLNLSKEDAIKPDASETKPELTPRQRRLRARRQAQAAQAKAEAEAQAQATQAEENAKAGAQAAAEQAAMKAEAEARAAAEAQAEAQTAANAAEAEAKAQAAAQATAKTEAEAAAQTRAEEDPPAQTETQQPANEEAVDPAHEPAIDMPPPADQPDLTGPGMMPTLRRGPQSADSYSPDQLAQIEELYYRLRKLRNSMRRSAKHE